MNDCMEHIQQYLSFLRESFTFKSTEQGCMIYTPFIGYDGDPVSFYINEIDDGNYIIRDMGDTLLYLEMFGIDATRGGNKEIFENILSIYNVKELNDEISLKTSKDKLGENINSFILALQAIMHLEYRKKPAMPVDFNTKAHLYCNANQLRHKYLYPIQARGEHVIDIVSIDEKNLIQALGTVLETPSQIKRYTEIKLFPFLELRILERKEYKISLYDDKVLWDNNSMIWMEDYSDEMIKWSERQKLIKVLAQ
ncbi:MAG: DUF1828 domain-containing protein [Candidatus Methanoperedens sp.]|nr:DUF1828 domain-containing protein [Candidatus Methanoperedens sp.]